MAAKKRVTKAELMQEVLFWRGIFGVLDQKVQRFMYAVGQPIEVRYRNYGLEKGVLKRVNFTVQSLEIVVDESTYEEKGERFVQEKVKTVPFSSLVDVAFLETRKAWQERDR